MTGVTISWNLQVVQDSECTPETPGETRRRSTPIRPPPHGLPHHRSPHAIPHTASPHGLPTTAAHAAKPQPHPPTPRPPPRTYCGTLRTTREVPRNSATTVSPQYKVTSVIPLRP